ncbi:hypothetical protein [Burkholderia vietnamiensis]|uniref:hypothetical protein n=1 Tax=Burkholderia vietnamiensis TaxID=60552 RepID=UPI0008415D2E|nr:hypothetical protein [Burkholderia vietnamiensis]AOK00719.1 hypothetical protein WK23_19955 [Burkholderia vietnamiensis]
MAYHLYSLSEARQAKDQAKRELAHVGGIVGFGLTKQGEGYVIKVNVNRAMNPGTLPKRIHGVPVIVEMVGAITKRHSPV